MEVLSRHSLGLRVWAVFLARLGRAFTISRNSNKKPLFEKINILFSLDE